MAFAGHCFPQIFGHCFIQTFLAFYCLSPPAHPALSQLLKGSSCFLSLTLPPHLQVSTVIIFLREKSDTMSCSMPPGLSLHGGPPPWGWSWTLEAWMQERHFRLLGLIGVSDGPRWALLRGPLATALRLRPLRGSGGARTPPATPGKTLPSAS